MGGIRIGTAYAVGERMNRFPPHHRMRQESTRQTPQFTSDPSLPKAAGAIHVKVRGKFQTGEAPQFVGREILAAWPRLQPCGAIRSSLRNPSPKLPSQSETARPHVSTLNSTEKAATWSTFKLTRRRTVEFLSFKCAPPWIDAKRIDCNAAALSDMEI